MAEALYAADHGGVPHKLSQDRKGLLLIIGKGKQRKGPFRFQVGNTPDVVAQKTNVTVEALPPESLRLIEHGRAGSSLRFLDEDSHNLIEAACRHDVGEDVVAPGSPEHELEEASGIEGMDGS